MGNNNLYKVENTLRSIAKRYKSVKYSLGLAILFLMMGVSAFSEEVVAQEGVMSSEQIEASKDNLKDSIGSLRSKIETARQENEKRSSWFKIRINSINGTRRSSSKITLDVMAIWSKLYVQQMEWDI